MLYLLLYVMYIQLPGFKLQSAHLILLRMGLTEMTDSLHETSGLNKIFYGLALE